MNIDNVVSSCFEAITNEFKSLKRLNIIIAGKTGVGKSTLINSVFRENLAETGLGRPVTQKICLYTKPDFPLRIYDTKGFELGNDVQKEVHEEIFETIKTGMAKQDINETIHCIWYCINATSDRIEDVEIEWLKHFTEENKLTQVPVIIILTKAFAKKQAEGFARYIDELNLNVVQVIPVLAQDYEVDEDYSVKAYGLDRLVVVMGNVLDKELLKTLMNVQKAAIAEKVKFSHGIVAASVATAAAEAAIPIPFADAAILVPTQVAMLASITVVFGMELDKGILSTFVSSTLGCGGATVLGKGIANFLKAIPGVGTVIGGVISAGTASSLTLALGEAYIKLMVLVAEGELNASDLNTEKGKTIFNNLFKKKA